MEPMNLEHLHIAEGDGIARITLNRAARLNALTIDMLAQLRSYFVSLAHRMDVRVVLLQGAGRAFCAGLDLDEQQEIGVRRSVISMLEQQECIRDIVLAMRRCPQPIVTIMQGASSGGGFALALASDIRLATPDARMNAAFIKLGLSGCDIAVSYFLPRMVGSSVASEFLLTGRFMDATRAHSLGLVSRVDALPALQLEAETLLGEMLDASPLGLRLTKDALRFALDAGSLEAVVAMEDRNQILCTQTADFQEGVNAFLQKRRPRYAAAGLQEP